MGRILVVDHDHSTVRAMTLLLRQDGYEVEPFSSGYSAVVALQSGRTFDAVVTDFEMPSVDGAAVARAARASSSNACIVVTDRGRADPVRLLAAGACVVLEKPIQYDAVHQVIAACRANDGYGGPLCARLRRRSGLGEKSSDPT